MTYSLLLIGLQGALVGRLLSTDAGKWHWATKGLAILLNCTAIILWSIASQRGV